ncbi:hypothetical protein P261_02276 [Lachnospiraceae bacterium TWA4]|nr:hypothetical protein P261_02276 [Lachnospiraceae bacterium TWA4]
MTSEALGYINTCMNILNIPYEYMQWTKELNESFVYAVGEYTEMDNTNEDGCEEGTFIITITTNDKYLVLEDLKKNKTVFSKIWKNGNT